MSLKFSSRNMVDIENAKSMLNAHSLLIIRGHRGFLVFVVILYQDTLYEPDVLSFEMQWCAMVHRQSCVNWHFFERSREGLG